MRKRTIQRVEELDKGAAEPPLVQCGNTFAEIAKRVNWRVLDIPPGS